MKRVFLIVLSAIMILSGCSKFSLSNKAKKNGDKASEAGNGKEYIVFASNGNNSGIYSMDSAGSSNTEVLKNSYQKAMGLSNRIIFYSEIDGKKGIYSANPDGKNVSLILEKYTLSDIPVINPDLSGFVFIGQKAGGSKEVYYMKMGASEPEKLTGIKSDKDSIKYISFLDSSTIVYSKKTKENGKYLGKIFRYSLSENKEEKFFESEYNCSSPVFSPDKSKMAYLSDKSKDYKLYILDINSKEEVEIPDKSPVFGGSVKWSQDGNALIFKAQNGDKKHRIKYVNAPDKKVKDIGEGYIANFSKDGKSVVYAAYNSQGKKQSINRYSIDEAKSNVVLEFEEPVNKAESINMLYCTDKIDI